ncbi:ribosomal protein S5 domain 2-type protein [Astrocystis sublimbata]|nr:ribosomal protein S5 domain 2-type protein [Astrocystis sublimbata]
MATTSQHLLLSPAELAYLHSSLSLTPPLRPDGRTATQFRPLTAETGILPGTNGSARVCFADGTEAVVGAKAEVEKTVSRGITYEEEDGQLVSSRQQGRRQQKTDQETIIPDEHKERIGNGGRGRDETDRICEDDWLELTVEIPGYRDDDSGTVFLASMLSESLLADGKLTKKLWINRRFHWKLYLDIILISPPLSYPLPLLSLTTHLALLSTRLPRLKSEGDEDPMFDDDWAASQFIFSNPSDATTTSSTTDSSRPPITLLVMAVGDNVIFDPSKEELAVADIALAVSVGEAASPNSTGMSMADGAMDLDLGGEGEGRNLRLLSVRTIDPPSRLTAPGVPNAVNASAWGHQQQHGNNSAAASASASKESASTGLRAAETGSVEGVWKAPRGGFKMGIMSMIVEKVLQKGGVADEVLEGLDGVELA